MAKQKPVSPELTALCARVQQWRKHDGGRGSRIPDELWHEAVRVARIDGLYPTAQHTHFNHQRLKAHCALMGHAVPVAEQNRSVPLIGTDNQSKCSKSSKEAPRFIDLGMAVPSPKNRTSIELWGRHGDRMRLEIEGDLDVVGLVQALWSRPS